MKNNPQLHHVAQNIRKGSLEIVLEMYELLGCQVVYRPPKDYQWAMVAQENLDFRIQVVEVDESPVQDFKRKQNTHIAFLSEDPQNLISGVKDWADKKGLKFREGGWNEKERTFDLPDVFINSVVEVMHTSVVE